MVSDCTQLETSLDIGPGIKPRVALTDKGYDSAANRAACRKRSILLVIPYRSNSNSRPSFLPKRLYKTRARVMQAIGKLKRFKRVNMRRGKTAESYRAIVDLTCSLISVNSVHGAKSKPIALLHFVVERRSWWFGVAVSCGSDRPRLDQAPFYKTKTQLNRINMTEAQSPLWHHKRSRDHEPSQNY